MRNNILVPTRGIIALLVAGAFVVTPVLAEKPEWAGKGGKSQYERSGKKQGDRDDQSSAQRDRDGRAQDSRSHFGQRQQVIVRDYYTQEFRSGNCPPGLAKKNNGCMPPGQAKKWSKGRPLPRDVVYYDLPPRLVVQLGTPPAGHKYVRVATDILLIAVGTSMVMDAITDLGRM
jgi:Ni/Co efflux regulator RcnB